MNQVLYEGFGKRMPLSDWVNWARDNLGVIVSYDCLHSRIFSGIPLEQAVSYSGVLKSDSVVFKPLRKTTIEYWEYKHISSSSGYYVRKTKEVVEKL